MKRAFDIQGGDAGWHTEVAPYRRDVDIGGCTVHCIDKGTGEPVLLIHGFADSTYCWHKNLEALLDAGLRVIVADQPGLGRSGLPPGLLSVEAQAARLRTLMERLGGQRFCVVGHSMGGGVALYLAWRHPELVRRVSVIAPASMPEVRCRLFGVPGMAHLLWGLGGRWAVRRVLRELYDDDALVTETLVEEYAASLGNRGMAQRLTQLCRQFFSPQYAQMARSHHELQTPLLGIFGARDPWIPCEHAARLERSVPGARNVVIADSGHLPHQERPEAVNPLLVEFLT